VKHLNTAASYHERLDSCESLRGIAISLVFFYHFLGSLRGYAPNPHANAMTALLFGGSTGVDLFFVLSGFLLSLPYFRGSPLTLWPYFTNRALRILPMYYLMILCALAWTGGHWRAALGAAVFRDVRPGDLGAFSLVWWSLQIEVQFYLALPLVIFLARRKWERLLLAAGILGLCLCYWRLASPSASPFWVGQRNTLLGRWPQFAAGMAAAWVHHRHGPALQKLGERPRRWLGTLLALIALASMDGIMLHCMRHLGPLMHTRWYAHYMYMSILWAVFLIALVDLRPAFRKLVVNPVLHRLGTWSYSIYLVHGVFMIYFVLRLNIHASDQQLGRYLPNLLLFVTVAGLTLVASAMTYLLVEKPFLSLKHGQFLAIGRVREDAM
jgi:peptidoglycan/LPS O-acetylase OafA/YrhL